MTLSLIDRITALETSVTKIELSANINPHALPQTVFTGAPSNFIYAAQDSNGRIDLYDDIPEQGKGGFYLPSYQRHCYSRNAADNPNWMHSLTKRDSVKPIARSSKEILIALLARGDTKIRCRNTRNSTVPFSNRVLQYISKYDPATGEFYEHGKSRSLHYHIVTPVDSYDIPLTSETAGL